MDGTLVSMQVTNIPKTLVTFRASEWFITVVRFLMFLFVKFIVETFVTDLTFKLPVICMNEFMPS